MKYLFCMLYHLDFNLRKINKREVRSMNKAMIICIGWTWLTISITMVVYGVYSFIQRWKQL